MPLTARTLAALLLASLVAVLPASAEPLVRVLNFTAQWCPSCRIIEPRLDAALAAQPEGRVERVDLDLTALRSRDETAKVNAIADVLRALEAAQASYLWDYYAGITGVVVLVAADTGEPLACLTRLQDAATMQSLIAREAARVAATPAGQRYAEGNVPENCP